MPLLGVGMPLMLTVPPSSGLMMRVRVNSIGLNMAVRLPFSVKSRDRSALLGRVVPFHSQWSKTYPVLGCALSVMLVL